MTDAVNFHQSVDGLIETLKQQIDKCQLELENNIKHGVEDPFYEQDIGFGQISAFKAVIDFIKSGQWSYIVGRINHDI